MTEKMKSDSLQEGDAVCDPIFNEWRIVEGVTADGMAFMKDGGLMSVGECCELDVLLPSEYEQAGSYAVPINNR